MEHLEQRLAFLRTRVQSAYDGLGQSTGRPYLYMVYPPDADLQVRRRIDELFTVIPSLYPVRIDLLHLTLDTLRGEEAGREATLTNPDLAISTTAPSDIAALWQDELRYAMQQAVETTPPGLRPLILLEGLAALHPLTNPTVVMEQFAEHRLDNPATGRPVPIVLFVPGFRVPHTSRAYYFLTQTPQPLLMYRGEDV
ncbi:MAG: hypothetical protein WCK70_06310 [Chloroflexales bacterium]